MRAAEPRKAKGSLLAALLYNEHIDEFDDRLTIADYAAPQNWSESVRKATTKRDQPNRKSFKRWTKVEEGILASLIDAHGQDWVRIAEHMTNRTPSGVEQHWQVMQGVHRSVTQTKPERKPSRQPSSSAAASSTRLGSDALPVYSTDEESDSDAHDGPSSPHRARLAFLAHEAELANAAVRPNGSSAQLGVPEWLPADCVSISMHAGEPPPHDVLVYATTIYDAEAID